MAIGLVCAIGAALAFGVGALLQAVAARREQVADGLDVRLLFRLLRHPVYVGAVVLYLVGFVLHFVALRTAPLFLAQAVISASVAVTAVLAHRVLGAPFGRVELGAVVAVCTGLFVLAMAADAHGTVTTTTGARSALLVAVAVIVAAAAVVARFRGEAAAVGLSLLSGAGYAVVALAGRVVPDLSPGTVVTDPATYALLLAGPAAFLLYSTALQRSGVLASTSALIVTQTGVPAVVGVVWLGDSVTAGWGTAAVAAFAVAVAGVVALSRRDGLAESVAEPVVAAVPGV